MAPYIAFRVCYRRLLIPASVKESPGLPGRTAIPLSFPPTLSPSPLHSPSSPTDSKKLHRAIISASPTACIFHNWERKRHQTTPVSLALLLNNSLSVHYPGRYRWTVAGTTTLRAGVEMATHLEAQNRHTGTGVVIGSPEKGVALAASPRTGSRGRKPADKEGHDGYEGYERESVRARAPQSPPPLLLPPERVLLVSFAGKNSILITRRAGRNVRNAPRPVKHAAAAAASFSPLARVISLANGCAAGGGARYDGFMDLIKSTRGIGPRGI